MRPHWRNHGNQVLVAKFFQSCIFKKVGFNYFLPLDILHLIKHYFSKVIVTVDEIPVL